MINILIRTHNRPRAFRRCIYSVIAQYYSPIKFIITVDNEETLEYVKREMAIVPMEWEIIILHHIDGFDRIKGEFKYNLYCNFLLRAVKEGWLFFLDDDDYIVHSMALESISNFFTTNGKENKCPIICQMRRGNNNRFAGKPSESMMETGLFRTGYIGMPCMFLPAEFATKVMLTDVENADFRWINAHLNMNGGTWINYKEVIVVSEKRNYGKGEF